MLVRDLMTPEPLTIGPNSDYLAAIALMRAGRFRRLPVVDADKKLIGIISAKDMHRSSPGAPKERALQSDGVLVRVGDIMTQPVISVPPDYPVEEAARLMAEHRIGCLPVVVDERVVGIVTDTDVFKAFINILGGGSQSIRVTVEVPNRPGEFAAVSSRVAAVGGNITSIASHPGEEPGCIKLTLRVESVPLQTLTAAIQEHPDAVIRYTWDESGLS